MPHKRRKLLLDISLSCQEILDFIGGKSFEDFQENRMLQLAIERQFEIIGEALYRLSRMKKTPLLVTFLNIVKSLTLEVSLPTGMILLMKQQFGTLQ
jgi:uncharacterized protein with HEPN domain